MFCQTSTTDVALTGTTHSALLMNVTMTHHINTSGIPREA